MKSLIKTFAILALTIVGMGNAWAETTPLTIPTASGQYIDWNNATLSNCSSSDGVAVGNTGDNSVATFSIHNSTEQEYIMSMKASLKENDADLTITLKDGEETKFTKDIHVTAYGDFNKYYNFYLFNLGVLPVSNNLTLEVKTKAKTGSYAGNWGYLAINTADQLKLPVYPNTLDLTKVQKTGDNPRYEAGNQNIGYVYNGGWCAFDVYAQNSGKYVLNMGIRKNKDGQFKVTITDVLTGTKEVEQTFTIPTPAKDYDNCTFAFDNAITKGLKKLRFDFIKEDESDWLFNFNNVTFVPTITLGTTGYATFSSAFPFTVSGASAYKASISGDEVTLSPIDGAIPANEGVVLYGTEGATATITAAESAPAIEGNVLKAVTTTDALAAGTNYVLATKDSETAFVKYTGSAAKIMNKAYLNIPQSGAKSALSISFEGNTATGIENIQTSASSRPQTRKEIRNGRLMIVRADNTVYNLSGARIK